MKIIRNFFWNVGYQVFVLLIPLITVPYINRVLGPSGVGINAFTNSVVQYFILAGSLGINLYGSRGIAFVRDDAERLAQYFWELVLLRFMCITVAVGIYLIFSLRTEKYQLYYLAQGLMLIGAAFDISWFFQGLENFRVTVLRNIVVKACSLILIFTLVRTRTDTLLYIAILGGAQFVGNLTMWPSVKQYVSAKIPLNRLRIFHHIRPSFGMLVPQLANQIYVQLNKTMLGLLVGVTVSGFYDNSDKIIKMLLAIVTATGTVLLPHVANNFAHGNHEAVRNSLKVSMHVILVIAFPLAFGVAAVSSTFTYYFFSPKFMPVSTLLAVEAIAIIPITIASAIGVQYLLPTKQTKAYTTSIFMGSITNVVINIPLILWHGALGAIIGTVLSEAVVTAYQVWYIRKQISIVSLFSETWKYFVSGLVMFVVVKTLDINLAHSVGLLIIEVIIGIIVYFLTLLLAQPKIVIGYVTDFLSAHNR